MAKVSSKNALIMLDDANGVARNISAACRAFEIQQQRATLPVTAFGDAHEVYALGRGGYAVGLDVLYDNTLTTGTYDVINTAVYDGLARTLSIYPQGLGGPVYSGEFVCVGPDYNGASSGMPVSLGNIRFMPASSTAPGFTWKYRDAVAYYPLVSDTLDYSGNARHMTVSGLTYSTGVNDGLTASVFDGTNASGTLLSGATWINGTTGTWSVWLKIDSATWTDSTSRIITRFSGDGTTNNYFELSRTTTNNRLQLYVATASNTKTLLYNTTGPTDWFNLVATWTATEIYLYNNAVVVASTTTRTGTWTSNSSGYYQVSPSTFKYKGQMAHNSIFAGTAYTGTSGPLGPSIP